MAKHSLKTGGSVPYLHLLICPGCHTSLEAEKTKLLCPNCARHFSVENQIPLLFSPNDPGMAPDRVTATVKAFYEENPFPDYEDTDDLARFIEKARMGVFAALLDGQIPFASRILECGCGTGQLSNFLGIAHRTVFGTDICLNSLHLAQGFKEENGLERVHFLQMNLFRPVFRSTSFDIVICNGVLHHSTVDPFLGFKTLANLVKPNGYLIAGLYHRYGRLSTDLRRAIFRLMGNRFTLLDPRLRQCGLSENRQSAWFADQYRHPHERKYTMAEVFRWLEPNGLELVKTIPKTRFFDKFRPDERLFQAEAPGRAWERRLVEIGMMFRDDREGGFFTIICRKKP